VCVCVFAGITSGLGFGLDMGSATGLGMNVTAGLGLGGTAGLGMTPGLGLDPTAALLGLGTTGMGLGSLAGLGATQTVTAPPIVTECLLVSNMFDPTQYVSLCVCSTRSKALVLRCLTPYYHTYIWLVSYSYQPNVDVCIDAINIY